MKFLPDPRGRMFRNWFGKKDLPLSGGPAVRRLKTYSAQSGYVYQYQYEGKRPWTGRAGDSGTGFVFTISADRKSWHPLSVIVNESAVQAWERSHGRTLSSTERYAIAKMVLFAAFDERESPAAMLQSVNAGEAEVAQFAERLGFE